jgi:hypothetical protein
MRRFHSDLRDAARALRNRPGFSTAVILTLALAIGANAAIFSAVDALLLRPLPFAEPDRLVRIQSTRGGQPGSLSYREVQDLRELRDVFVDVAAYTDQGQTTPAGSGVPKSWCRPSRLEISSLSWAFHCRWAASGRSCSTARATSRS